MKLTTHGNNLIQLTHAGWVNCYLVREDDGFTLIDAVDTADCAPQIIQAAQSLGLPIVRIALTHAHGDHIGALDALHRLPPAVEVAVGTREARILAGDMSLDLQEAQDKIRGGYHPIYTRPSRLLNEGDRVGSLEVVASPGHTPGQVAFLDTRDRSLIVGDALQTLWGVAVTGMLTLFPLPYFATWHLPTALVTARTLRALEPSRLTVGHGPVLTNLAEMDRAIERAARKVGTHAQGALA